MDFEFDSDGFLTERIGDLEKAIRATYPALFARAPNQSRLPRPSLFSGHSRSRRKITNNFNYIFTNARYLSICIHIVGKRTYTTWENCP